MIYTITLAIGILALACACAWSIRRTSQRVQQIEQQLETKTLELQNRDLENLVNESRYRDLFQAAPVVITVSELDGKILDINDAGVAVFGFPNRDEALAVNIRSLYVNPADRDRRVANAMTSKTSMESDQCEFLMRRKDGSSFAALSKVRFVRNPDGSPRHMIGFFTDISDIRRLEADHRAMEQEQRISSRLQSVGALAAGIAHEINTPMQFVSDSVYFLQTAINELNPLWPVLTQLAGNAGEPVDPKRIVRHMQDIVSLIDIDNLVLDANSSAARALEGIRRITTIIRAMRDFAHPDHGEKSNVDINKAIETTLTVCRNVYKEVADVETDLGDLPQVLCQFGEINQVFLNIIVNAAHAIEAQNKGRGTKGLIRIITKVEDDWAVIGIQDNGTGIPESVKNRIFDPFFTTKEVGKGTGQGLAIVRSVIVDRHKGRISVDSEIGKGTTFTLRLPIPVEASSSLFSGAANEES